VGAIVAPLVVPWITIHLGWRWAFGLLGGAGLLWIVAWLLIYADPSRHPRLTRAELDYIRSDPPDPEGHIHWRVLIANRPVWGLTIARFLTDPIWWFYLYWGPKFLNSQFGLKLDQIGVPIAILYLLANTGGIFGGWLSAYLIRRGWSTGAARKLAMLACALMVLPVALATTVPSQWAVVGLIALAMAGHQGWAANVFTIVSDQFPRRAVSSVVGICGFGGAVGGMVVASAVGLLLQATGSYLAIFALAGLAYLVGLGIIQWTSRDLDAISLE
jgi:ACS family hexuronate transporter-like MFS transporter